MRSRFKARLIFLSVLLSIGGAAVIVRLFTIQVIDGPKYAERSRDQTQQRHILSAKRGIIFDRKGRAMAVSTESRFSVETEMLGVPQRKGADRAVIRRMYPQGEIAGAVLGYIGSDGYGMGGAEFSFDNYLRGEDGWIILQKDGRNHKYRKIGLPSKAPRDGNDVYLTIDLDIQEIVYTVLKQTVEKLRAKGGMCIVMDPFTGKVLAMANEPSFNPNFASRYPLAQRKNRCMSSIYEPGSTFKIVAATAALQDNIKKEADLIDGNNGRFEIYDEVIRDHEKYGLLTFKKALAVSSNVCFAKIANEIGNDRLYRFTRNFGFGAKCGIELPGEECGIVHPVKEWSGRTRVTMAIGQEISVTLLQMMLPYAAVANGGVLVNPLICEKISDHYGSMIDSAEYKPVRRVMSQEVSKKLIDMLEGVVVDGTGKNAAITGISVAGKTGTSQKLDSAGVYSKTLNWSSFIGFVPANNPVLLCGIVIDEPESNEMGAVAAAPAFRKIMTQIISDPELEYAERILQHGKYHVEFAKHNDQTALPQVCGMTIDSACSKLGSMKIAYRIAGNGARVTFQTPAAGAFIDKDEEVMVYAVERTAGDGSKEIPDCKGKDLRDAVNMINLKGLRPYVVGCGTVFRQVPSAGSLIRSAQACTLYCAFTQ